jgi:hypothetical protein
MTINAPEVGIAPDPSPVPFGLFSVADVRPGGARTLFGRVFDTDACQSSAEAGAWCDPDADDKIVTDATYRVSSRPFTVYTLLRCRLLGSRDIPSRAAAIAANSEERAVERAFMAHVLSADLDPTGGTDRATDITPTPGTAVCPELGVALLEGFMGRVYAGLPVLHVPRTLGSLLGTMGALVRNGNRLETVQRTPVASGTGYDGEWNIGPDGTAVDPADGTYWLYATGVVELERGEEQRSGLVPVRAAGGGYENEGDSLIERAWAANVDCIRAAVLVNTPCLSSPVGGA